MPRQHVAVEAVRAAISRLRENPEPGEYQAYVARIRGLAYWAAKHHNEIFEAIARDVHYFNTRVVPPGSPNDMYIHFGDIWQEYQRCKVAHASASPAT